MREGDRIGRWKRERGPGMEAVPCWQTLRLYLSLFYSALSSSASLFLSRSDPFAYPLPPDYSFSLLRPYSCVLSSVNSVKPRGSGSGWGGGESRCTQVGPTEDEDGIERRRRWTQPRNTQWRRRTRKCGIFDGLSEAVSVISGRFVCAIHTLLTSIYLRAASPCCIPGIHDARVCAWAYGRVSYASTRASIPWFLT